MIDVPPLAVPLVMLLFVALRLRSIARLFSRPRPRARASHRVTEGRETS